MFLWFPSLSGVGRFYQVYVLLASPCITQPQNIQQAEYAYCEMSLQCPTEEYLQSIPAVPAEYLQGINRGVSQLCAPPPPPCRTTEYSCSAQPQSLLPPAPNHNSLQRPTSEYPCCAQPKITQNTRKLFCSARISPCSAQLRDISGVPNPRA